MSKGKAEGSGKTVGAKKLMTGLDAASAFMTCVGDGVGAPE